MEKIRRLPLTEADRQKILGGNIAKLANFET